MKHIRTMVGGAIAGIFVMSVWGAFAGKYGIAGGWFAGFAIIGTMWFLNHYIGIMHNPGAFVDQAVAIGVCGTLIPVFKEGSITPLVDALPTLAVVIVGGIVGGVCAAMFQKDLAKQEAEAKQEA